MTDVQSILAAATQLPVDQRLTLIDALWETIPPEAEAPLSDKWRAEIERRWAEYETGKVKTIPWEVVRKDSFRRAGINETD